jgi:putative MATE family efflux protein
MKDLTQGSIRGHLITMAIPMVIGMAVQMLYYLVDLYFVGQLGAKALAGVSAAGTTTLMVLGLTQMLSVGTVALVSHAIGAREQERANHLFQQSLLLGCIGALLSLIFGYLLAAPFVNSIASDKQVAQLGLTYLYWYMPGLALQFVLAAAGSVLRAAGLAQPALIVQLATVLLNIILAPILITGWGTGYAMGVAGAGLASTISVAVGVVMLLRFCVKSSDFFSIQPTLRPNFSTWGKMLKLGLPVGGEYLLMFAFSAYVYFLLRQFGDVAQAGFGVGARILQVIFLPAAALGFAIPAVAGQNFGAGLSNRVRETFRTALVMESMIMLFLAVLCQFSPKSLLAWSNTSLEVQAFAITYLRYLSWNFLGAGIMFACSGIFQAVGNTWPTLFCAALRVLTFVIPLAFLSSQLGFEVPHIWKLSIASTLFQAAVGLYLAHRILNKVCPIKPLTVAT